MRVFLFFSLFLIFLALPLLAENIILEGDRYQFDRKNEILTYTHPRATIKKMVILGNELVYHKKTGILYFTGNIVMRSGVSVFTANRVEHDKNSGITTLFETTMYDKKNEVHVKAKKIERESEDRYIIHEGTITVCKPDEPAWEFYANQIVYMTDNFAYAYNTIVNFYGVPIFYTPFFSWPTKVGRATGMLEPRFTRNFGDSDESKNWGNRLEIPYFINLDRDHDLTLTFDLLERRGFGLDFDYRYAFSPGMSGQIRSWAIDESVKDRDLDYEQLGSQSAEDVDLQPLRYRYNIDHRQNVFWGGQFFFHQHENSDNEINREYFDSDTTKEIFKSRALSFVFPWQQGSLSLVHNEREDFLYSSIYDKSTDKDAHLNKQPELNISQGFSGIAGTPLSLNFSETLTQYARRDTWSGLYSRSGMSANAPFHLDFLNIIPGIRRDFYYYHVSYNRSATDTSNPDFEETPDSFGWSIDQAQLELNFEVFRIYNNDEDTGIGRLSFRPRFIFAQVEDEDQRQALMTSPTSSTLTGAGVDYSLKGPSSDYTLYSPMFITPIKSQKHLTFRLETQYLTKDPQTKQIRKSFQLNLIQIQNFNRKDSIEENNQSFFGPVIAETLQETELGDQKLPLRLELSVSPIPRFSANLFYRYDHKEGRIIESKFGLSTSTIDGNRYSMSYTNNTKAYEELDGTNRTIAQVYTLSNLIKFGNSLDMELTGKWDQNRNNLNARFGQTSSERLDRQLTEATAIFRFNYDCYQYILAYSEEIVGRTIEGVSSEGLDQKIEFSLNLIGWPGTSNPFKQKHHLSN